MLSKGFQTAKARRNVILTTLSLASVLTCILLTVLRLHSVDAHGVTLDYLDVLPRVMVIAVAVSVLVAIPPRNVKALELMIAAQSLFSAGHIIHVWSQLPLVVIASVYLLGYILVTASVWSMARGRLTQSAPVLIGDVVGLTLIFLMFTGDTYLVPALRDIAASGLVLVGALGALHVTFLFVGLMVCGLCVRLAVSRPLGNIKGLLVTTSAVVQFAGVIAWRPPHAYSNGLLAAVMDASVLFSCLAYLMVACLGMEQDPATTATRSPSDATFEEMAVLAGALLVPVTCLATIPWWGPQGGYLVSSVSACIFAVGVAVRLAVLVIRARGSHGVLVSKALTDPLTGAANRAGWEQSLVAAEAHAHASNAVIMMDLDRFKEFNDAEGHVRGDELLIAAVAAWQADLPEDAVLGRLGGDEFAVLVLDCTASEAERLACRLRAHVWNPVTCSVGVALWLRGQNVADRIEVADKALYAAKRAGRNAVKVSRVVDIGSGSCVPASLVAGQRF